MLFSILTQDLAPANKLVNGIRQGKKSEINADQHDPIGIEIEKKGHR